MTLRPSSDEIKDRLLPQSADGSSYPADFKRRLSTKTFLSIPITDLVAYDMNPRRIANPNFDRIKQSIMKDGINQPLVVTQRPSTEKFMIYKGGNTRLKALKELYSETGDRRFRVVDCSFHPWTGYESDAIIGHLQENDLRKSLCFIDRSFGTKLAIEHLKAESGQDDLSLRDIRSMFANKGYSMTLSTLSVMLYAIENLEPVLSREVCISMGRPQVQKLRALENAFKKVGSELNISDEKMTGMFLESLNAYDEQQWSHSLFRRTLESNLCHSQSLTLQDIALRLDGYLHLSETPLKNSPAEISEEYVYFDDAECPVQEVACPVQDAECPVECTKMVHDSGVYSVNTPKTDEIMHQNGAFENNAQPSNNTQLSSKKIKIPAPIFPFSVSGDDEVPQAKLDIEKLRQQSYRITWRLAKRYDFQTNAQTKNTIVTNTGNWGVGFLITDYPSNYSDANLNRVGARDALWWWLLELCDFQWATERARPFIAKLVGSSDLLHFVKSNNPRSLYFYSKGIMKCTYPHMSLLGLCMRQLDDNSWDDINQLTAICRRLHFLSRENGILLFQLPK